MFLKKTIKPFKDARSFTLKRLELFLLYLKEINLRRIINILKGRKPTWKQWTLLPKTLTYRERWIARVLFLLIILSFFSVLFNTYIIHTQIEPKTGGTYKEGIIGQPRYINPVLAQTNDADRDLSQLIFSGPFKYDDKGNLIADLAEKYTIDDQGKVYDIVIKKNVFWHDEQPLTIDDVIFTIKTIQNAEYKSPLRVNWQGIEIEKIDDYTVRFRLKNTYAPFLHNLTVGIIPKHRWAGISSQDFPLAEYNLKPIGCGPYQFEEFSKDKSGKIQSIELARYDNYHLAKTSNEEKNPFIEKIIFRFYKTQEELIEGYNSGAVDAISNISIDKISEVKENYNLYQIRLPIYYAVFFNQTESKALADKNVRIAFSHATDKKEILEKVLNNMGVGVDSPFLPSWLGFSQDIETYQFDIEKAKQILEENGWQDKDEDGIREKKINNDKEETKLEITLVTTNWPDLSKTVQIVREQWEKIGARINLEIVEPDIIQQEYIRPREYQSLFFGEILGADPDPFAFWHSSQRKDPGLNLSLYQNKEADKLLEDARQTLDEQSRKEKYAEFQKILSKEVPAVFFYSPSYLYLVNEKVKGIGIEKLAIPSQRLSQTENWYIKTKRIRK